MTKIDWKRKLTSRKWWISIATFASMLIVASGAGEDTAKTVTALIMAGASAIAYTIGEGLADMGHAQDIEIETEIETEG